MAKINVKIPIRCEKDVTVTIDSPIRPCCFEMEMLLVKKIEMVRLNKATNPKQVDYCLLHIDNGYWIPMLHCPFCGKKIELADKKKRKSKKTYEEYDFIEYQPLKG